MENEMVNNSFYYRFSEKGIKQRNYDLWEKIYSNNNEDISFKEKFYLYENLLKFKPKCYCGGVLKFIDMNKGFRDFCSKKCMYQSADIKEKRKKTCIEKWGVDNPSKCDLVKEKVKQTNNEIFGVDYPLQNSNIMNKIKDTFIEKFGVDNPSKVKDVREKAENTMVNKFGVKHAMQSDEIKGSLKQYFTEKFGVDNPSKVKDVREKAENTMFNRWGVKHALQNKDILDKLQKTNIEKWGKKCFTSTQEYRDIINEHVFNKNSILVNDSRYTLIKSEVSEYLIQCKSCNSEFNIQRQLWRNRNKSNIDICLNCNPIFNGFSKEEKKLYSYIKEIYDGEIIENYKLDKKEIDVYLPELKIGFEYNGLYWHSELNKNRNYHYDKMLHFNKRGINLIQIWEDDWQYKTEIVKSMIGNRIGKSIKIAARKCRVMEISDNVLVRKFLEDNHIQGFIGSKIKIGLFYNDELVSLMTFGNLRRSLGQYSKENCYELLRFCNKTNISVIGGASKLFNYFLNNFKINEVISYSLNSYSTGNLYKQLKFEFTGETGVNYFWCKNGIKYHRFNFRKDKLVKEGFFESKTETEIMYDRGYFRIFDCGSKRFVYKNF